MSAILQPTPHPVVPLPDEQWMIRRVQEPGGAAEVAAVLAKRERAISQMASDPYNFGYVPDIWNVCDSLLDGSHPLVDEPMDELLILGGNRAAKSEYCARKNNKILMSGPGKMTACLHSSQAMSIAQQQARVFKYLPNKYKDIGKGDKFDKTTHVLYSMANGFTNGKFILPDEQTCFFFNYLQDVKVMEGPEYDFAWLDELAPLSYVEALRFRLVTRRGKLIVSFTPVDGYTQTVASFVAGAEIILSELSPILPHDKVYIKGLPPGHMPRILRCRGGDGTKRNAAIVCFWTIDNPFNPWDQMVKVLAGQKTSQVMIRAHGWATKSVQGDFANFNDKVHKITRKQFRELEEQGGTRYVSCDPAGAKPWVIKWYFVTPDDEVIVYREWPSVQEFGNWAKPGDKLKFEYDEGMKDAPRYGMNGYKELIWMLEGAVWDESLGRWDRSNQEDILMRFMDPRFGGKVSPGAEQGTSIIELMDEDKKDESGRERFPAMQWEPAPASRVSETVQMINDFMKYDDSKPVDMMNHPKWYVLDECKNSIYAYQEFTELAGDKCALKDVVDPDRYFVKTGWLHFNPDDFRPRGGGAF